MVGFCHTTPIKDGDYMPYKKAILPDVPHAAMPYPRSAGYRASVTTSNGPMPLTGRPIAHETDANPPLSRSRKTVASRPCAICVCVSPSRSRYVGMKEFINSKVWSAIVDHRGLRPQPQVFFGKEVSARALRQRIVGDSIKVDEQASQPIPGVTRHKRRKLT